MSDTNEILDYLDEKLQPIVSAGHWDVYSELHDMISRLLSEQPDVIRCRDCKYCIHAKTGKLMMCDSWRGNRGLVHDDDFCSHAERKVSAKMEMTDELRNCPFCKSNNVEVFDRMRTPIWLVCNDCKSIFPNRIEDWTEEQYDMEADKEKKQ